MTDIITNGVSIAAMGIVFWYFTVYRKKKNLLKIANLELKEVTSESLLSLYEALNKTLDKSKYFILLNPRLDDIVINPKGFDQATIKYIAHNSIDMTICSVKSRTALLGVVLSDESLNTQHAVKTSILNGAKIGICGLSPNDIENHESVMETANTINDFVIVAAP